MNTENTTEAIETINIDGNDYPIKDLSNKVKGMVAIYNQWNIDLKKVREKAFQLECASVELSRLIIKEVEKEVNKEESTDE